MVKIRTASLLGLLAAAFLNISATVNRGWSDPAPEPRLLVRQQAQGMRRVLRVVDGDTLLLFPKERVRLIGVDTPETVHPKKAVECFGPEAKEFNRKTVEGKPVLLTLDENNVRGHHRDKYGRTLAYVYLEDGRLLNAELIRHGYGHAETRFRFSYLVEFLRLEKEARDQGLGLWSRCTLR